MTRESSCPFYLNSHYHCEKIVLGMTNIDKLSWWKKMYNVILPIQTESYIVHDRIVLKLYDVIWDVKRKLYRINLNILMSCDYCGKVKVKLVEDIWRKIIRTTPDHFKNTPYGSDNSYITQNHKSRQVRICHNCIDSMI